MIELIIFVIFSIIWSIVVLLATIRHYLQILATKRTQTCDQNNDYNNNKNSINKVLLCFSLINNYRNNIRVSNGNNGHKTGGPKASVFDGIRGWIHLGPVISHYLLFIGFYSEVNTKYTMDLVDHRVM